MPTNNDGAPREKPKKDRACDACRRRKTKCDGSVMRNHMCSNCIQSRKPCTYVEESKPRGPPKAYITTLEDRVEALEALLQQIRPDQDFSEELGPPVVRGSWKNGDGSLDTFTTSSPRKSPLANKILPPLLIPYNNTSGNRNHPTSNSQSPRSTHLIFQSRLPSRRMRIRLTSGIGFSSSSEETSDGASSSSEQVEETVITSLVGRERINLFASENDDTTEENNIRFHGRSSTAGLIETTRQFKHMHIRDATHLTTKTVPDDNHDTLIPDNLTVTQWRRPVFWKRPAWEYSHDTQRLESMIRLRTFLEYFPSQELANTLINLYFQNSNSVFPLLHRPTFSRQWQEQLHHRNIWFAGVCLLVFAIGSRWCNDERVLPDSSSRSGRRLDWGRAGRHYFDIVVEIHLIRQTFFHPTSLFEVQTFALMGMYLRSTVAFPTAWIVISAGLRKVQDVGAHRKKVYRSEPNIDDELWKRAFWLLVVHDRIGAALLGRPCGISEEDFDLELPLEVDDEYWDTNPDNFKQPPGIPSTATAFVQLIKLTQIMAFTVRTLYAINKSKVNSGIMPVDRESLRKQISLAMAEWLERLPEHLHWQDKNESPIFLKQSATLIAHYHLIQMLVWHPLIALHHRRPFGKGSNENISTDFFPFPKIADLAMIYGTEAALAYARIVEVQLQRGINLFHIPDIINVSYICAGTLLVHGWNMKVLEKESSKATILDMKPPFASRIEHNVANAKIFLGALEAVKPRWEIVNTLIEDILELLNGLEKLPPIDTYHYSETSDPTKTTSPAYVTNRDDGKRSPRSTPQDQFSNGVIHSSGDSENNDHILIPAARPTHNTHRASYTRVRRVSINTTLPTEGRSPINAPASVSSTAWHERGVPFISSMRRASSSSIRSQNDHLGRDKDISNGRPLLPVESAVRYDVANTQSDDRIHLSAPPRYPQHVADAPHAERPHHRAGGYGICDDRFEESPIEDRGWQVNRQYPHGGSNVLLEDRHVYGKNAYSNSKGD